MKCVICGREFEPSKYHRKVQICCNAECRRKRNAELYRLRKSGERQVARKRESSTYSKNRQITPALESFFTEFAMMIKE